MEKTKQPLSTFRLVAGIITIVLSVLVTFQSCAAGLSNALEENGNPEALQVYYLQFVSLLQELLEL